MKRDRGRITIPLWYIITAVIGITLSVFLFVSASGIKKDIKENPAREALTEGYCITSSNYIEDETGWITNRADVMRAMDYFYEKTGVQPFLYITESINGEGINLSDSDAEAALKSLYDSLYSDEGHIIFCIVDYGINLYHDYLYAGNAADRVIDEKARNIFLNNFEKYYWSDTKEISDDECLEKTFTDSADEIMKSTETEKEKAEAYVAAGILIVLILIIILTGIIKKEKEKAQLRHMKEILDIDITDTSKNDELIEKYKDR